MNFFFFFFWLGTVLVLSLSSKVTSLKVVTLTQSFPWLNSFTYISILNEEEFQLSPDLLKSLNFNIQRQICSQLSHSSSFESTASFCAAPMSSVCHICDAPRSERSISGLRAGPGAYKKSFFQPTFLQQCDFFFNTCEEISSAPSTLDTQGF